MHCLSSDESAHFVMYTFDGVTLFLYDITIVHPSFWWIHCIPVWHVHCTLMHLKDSLYPCMTCPLHTHAFEGFTTFLHDIEIAHRCVQMMKSFAFLFYPGFSSKKKGKDKDLDKEDSGRNKTVLSTSDKSSSKVKVQYSMQIFIR